MAKKMSLANVNRLAEKNRIEALGESTPNTEIEHYFWLTEKQRKEKIKKGAREDSWR